VDINHRQLRALREERGLRQTDLAKAASISNGYLSMLESGQRRTVSPPVAARLAGALGVAINDLEFTSPRLHRPR
jgi:transcriptional regulator with XRE-family HTH domain